MIIRVNNAESARKLLAEIKHTTDPLQRGDKVIAITNDELMTAGRKARAVMRYVNRRFAGLFGDDITFHIESDLLIIARDAQTICNKILSKSSGASERQKRRWRRRLLWFRNCQHDLRERIDMPAGSRRLSEPSQRAA